MSDLNLVPTTLDEERTGGVDLGLGTIPLPFANFKKSECACVRCCLSWCWCGVHIQLMSGCACMAVA